MRRLTASFRRLKASLVAVGGLVCLIGWAGAVRAQTPTQSTINLGGRSWGAAESPHTTTKEPDAIQFSMKAGIASDYIYRGVTLSDHRPAIGAGIEATYGWLYAGTTVASVKLPTQPT